LLKNLAADATVAGIVKNILTNICKKFTQAT